MRNFNIGIGMEEEPISYVELEKATDLIGLIVIDEEGLSGFIKALDGLVVKGQSGTITPDEIETLEKGKKDISKLVKKQVIGKDGKKKTVYVKAGAPPKKEEGGKKPEDHAKDTHDHKLNKYINEGKDEGLKKIAKEEMNRRKSEASKAKYAAAQSGSKDKPNSKQAELNRHAKSKKEADDAENPVIGKTKSGKFVFANHDGGGHEGFTSKDHEDAHALHSAQASKHKQHDPHGEHKSLQEKVKFHEKEASTHAKLANSKKVVEKVEKKYTGAGMPTYNKETNQYRSGKQNDEMASDNMKPADFGNAWDNDLNMTQRMELMDEANFSRKRMGELLDGEYADMSTSEKVKLMEEYKLSKKK